MLVNACVIELKFFKAANVVTDMIEKMEFEGAQIGGVMGAQDKRSSFLKRANVVVKCRKTFFCSLCERVASHGHEKEVCPESEDRGI